MKNLNQQQTPNYQGHSFHIVELSPWPYFLSLTLLSLLLSVVMYFHYFTAAKFLVSVNILILVLGMFFWFRDIVIEGTFQGFHTRNVQRGLRYGMILFITSEVMFFFGFFWAFFHSSLVPSIWIGSVWPPVGIEVLDIWSLPFLNTLILLSSGVSVTLAHAAILNSNRYLTFIGLLYTVVLGLVFLVFQLYEYVNLSFNINDSVFGSVFYVATGFHGLHVFVGMIMLAVGLIRHYYYHFTSEHHVGLEAAIWYWHFVDVVWLFLFIMVYWWGN